MNYFEAARIIQTKKRSTIGFQTFDKVSFMLSLKRTTKKIRKALKIISLSFLILSCQVVTKGHTSGQNIIKIWSFGTGFSL